MAAFNNVDPVLQSEKAHSDDFLYDLPDDLIAEHPANPRDASQLMVVRREESEKEFIRFRDVIKYLNPGDVLVVNNSKVYPAKFDTIKVETGDHIDVFLLRELEPGVWEAQVSPPRKVRIGNTLEFDKGLRSDIVDNTVSSGRVIQFQNRGADTNEILRELGKMPLPRYINREPIPSDREKYQTIFAKKPGSVAVPAGALHFTEELVNDLTDYGVHIAEITVHLGLGGYERVTLSEIDKYSMNAEYYNISVESADIINEAKDNGNKVIAVGASVVRALLSSHFKGRKVIPKENWTDLFVFPPFHFHLLDGIISNFHQPQAPSLLMQSAFYGKEKTIEAYEVAVKEKMRFEAFGDALMILR
ncbi:MAG: tRNA preQ1(34) S-adenosylmethionine ribosyltransferase-isomerase QueA [Candidatus Marinimicrobia bacterium]|nr:tRNA preQ1(34) S-adenosylmethionine ribosyltransferase-isomerase QueA [Candidatus Neomarinimicrobiota bacterium]MCF7828236.1 tRNA preQ1(34) S-adenosylmethionine ribosyltransferase-isomerase QueA [Candidatus Neomarinimicrobiota bacterium]MCF7879589.1 tRNA preQ1(34) S-adenosylmethionine ribosyltransferase-isomerase QueA [Candidatus Neomarinimicrobiota bacterium]